MSSVIHRVIVGTAGHIDHGKSSLVRRLTGIDPDRLKEEQARGMTIDLGFAPYRTESAKTVGIIDVPGHERFVKNMVAGACSVDIFLLVVAADDGVMPQTREHIEILDLLGAQKGIVVVTKIDLVDRELRELAVGEIQEYLAATPFSGAPLVPVSTTTGEGIPELRNCLDRMIDATQSRESSGLFRMPIQRVFSAAGHGTVLTGVPVSGTVRLGELLEVMPHGFTGKVRAIEAYREKREDAQAGHSTALNLSDVDYRRVRRGDVVGAPGSFRPARLLEAELRYLASAPRPLKHGGEVRLHLGTAESLARVVL
ncbi:MAG: selenocysteine-specific translation elongation factor, partial [Planctomycetota bacterium]